VFGMIPPPGDQDPAEVHERYALIASGASEGIGGETYYGYRGDLLSEVRHAFAEHGVPVDGERISLHPGLFADTLEPTGPVAFAHIDCDWYEPVLLTLERIHPHLSPGGFVISDDYHDWEGARRAVDEFMAAHDDLERVEREGGHLILRRRRS
jgi:O-methyltransferase